MGTAGEEVAVDIVVVDVDEERADKPENEDVRPGERETLAGRVARLGVESAREREVVREEVGERDAGEEGAAGERELGDTEVLLVPLNVNADEEGDELIPLLPLPPRLVLEGRLESTERFSLSAATARGLRGTPEESADVRALGERGGDISCSLSDSVSEGDNKASRASCAEAALVGISGGILRGLREADGETRWEDGAEVDEEGEAEEVEVTGREESTNGLGVSEGKEDSDASKFAKGSSLSSSLDLSPRSPSFPQT